MVGSTPVRDIRILWLRMTTMMTAIVMSSREGRELSSWVVVSAVKLDPRWTPTKVRAMRRAKGGEADGGGRPLRLSR